MASIGASARAERGPVGLLYMFLVALITASIGMAGEKLGALPVPVQREVATDLLAERVAEMPALKNEIQAAIGAWQRETGLAAMQFSAEHALKAHGRDAVLAAQAIAAGNFGRCKSPSGNREALIKPIGPRSWAVVVMDVGTYVGGLSWLSVLDLCVTSFIADQDYVKSLTERCPDDWGVMHQ